VGYIETAYESLRLTPGVDTSGRTLVVWFAGRLLLAHERDPRQRRLTVSNGGPDGHGEQPSGPSGSECTQYRSSQSRSSEPGARDQSTGDDTAAEHDQQRRDAAACSITNPPRAPAAPRE
jgi:hypothetical protein